jgi:hypothetical protein
LIDPITLADGKILDGRNRYRAMRFIDPDFSPDTAPKMFVKFDGDSPTEFVISKNLHRRHLNESQRALIAARLALANPAKKGSPNPKAATIAARMKVSLDSVNRAKRVIRHDPSRVAAVEAGTARVGIEYRPRLRISVQDITDAEASAFQHHCEKIGSTMSDVVLVHPDDSLVGAHRLRRQSPWLLAAAGGLPN